MTVASLQAELHRTKEELQTHRAKLNAWEEGLRVSIMFYERRFSKKNFLQQARQACEAWKREAELYRLRAQQLEQLNQRMREERDMVSCSLHIYIFI